MQTIKARLEAVFYWFIDIVLPPLCIISGEEVSQQGQISPKAWADLVFIDDPLCDLCGIPFDFEVEEKTVCAGCLETTPVYDSARSCLVYDDHSRDVVLSFKHADKTHAVKAFTPWFSRVGVGFLAEADYVVPVPLHYGRMVKRRYNQAALIAQELCKAHDIPLCLDGLIRTKATVSQGRMAPKQRRDNVRTAFKVNDKHKATLAGKVVLLIDDVYTTGATVEACAKTLRKAGVSKVYVLTLARVVRHLDTL